MAKTFPDYLIADEAERLAKKIAQFWHDQGHSGVRVWTEKVPGEPEGRTSCFCVRSNLIGGMPRP